jgi:hypothetical protein
MIERTFHTPGPLRLDLEVPAGEIEVDTVDGDETAVTLDCDDPRALDGARVELRPRGSGHELVVATERRAILGGIVQVSIGPLNVGGAKYRLHVRCPHGADLRARTASAQVDGRGRFGLADVQSASGDVVLGEVDGDLVLKTVSGDAVVRRVGGTLAANLVSGDLAVSEAQRSAQAKTVSGDVHLVVREGKVGIVSVSGDIEVGVRSGSRLHVDANSVSGVLDSEVPLADAPAAAGGDGPLVELRVKTVSGDFRVVRA